jgi:hypothetical protein
MFDLDMDYESFFPDLTQMQKIKPTRNELLCMFVRRAMYSMPFYKPPEYKLHEMFKKKQKGLNSYRNIGLKIVKNFWYTKTGDFDHQFFVKFEALKRLYYHRYRLTINTENTIFKKETKTTEEELDRSREELSKLESKVLALESDIKTLHNSIHFKVSGFSFRRMVVENFKKYREGTQRLNEVDVIYHFDRSDEEFITFRLFVAEIAKNKNQRIKQVDKLIKYQEIINKLNQVRNKLMGILYINSNPELLELSQEQVEEQSDLMEFFDEILDVINEEIDIFEKKRDNWAKEIKGVINDYLKKIYKTLFKNKSYKKYVDEIKLIVKKKKDLNFLQEERNLIEARIDTLNGILIQNQELNDNVKNMIIPRNLKGLINAEIAEIKTFLSTDQILEQAMKVDPQWDLNIKMMREKHENSLDPMERLKELQNQLDLLELIEEMERKIDGFLGHVYRILMTQMNGLRCFSMSTLSYTIFAMIKTNIILHQKDFFRSFFNGMSHKKMTEFIIFNYRVFMNEGFMKDLTKQMRLKANSSQERVYFDDLRDTFVRVYTRMMNMFKELTVYRNDDLQKYQKKVGFMDRIWQAMLDNYNIAWSSGKAVIKPLIVKSAIEECLKLIPILGNIQWLRKMIAGAMVWFLFYLIKKYLKKLPGLIREVYVKVRHMINAPDFVDLDWQMYINESLDYDNMLQDPNHNMQFGVHMFEKAYHTMLEESKEQYSNLDNFFIFKEHFLKHDDLASLYLLYNSDNTLIDEKLKQEIDDELEEADKSLISEPLDLLFEFSDELIKPKSDDESGGDDVEVEKKEELKLSIKQIQELIQTKYGREVPTDTEDEDQKQDLSLDHLFTKIKVLDEVEEDTYRYVNRFADEPDDMVEEDFCNDASSRSYSISENEN